MRAGRPTRPTCTAISPRRVSRVLAATPSGCSDGSCNDGPAARLVAAGVPLRRSGVTLGECDFLVQTQQGARLHWELAVKCYLHAGESRTQLTTQSAARLADYVGPNLKDRFDLKLAHVLNHQLPLSAREEFASVGHAGPWTPQMFIKGWLFYRAGETPADPVELDPSHGRGWWVTRSEWTDFAEAHAQMWRVLSTVGMARAAAA
jgi:Uncharacterized protein conserved in bacteria